MLELPRPTVRKWNAPGEYDQETESLRDAIKDSNVSIPWMESLVSAIKHVAEK